MYAASVCPWGTAWMAERKISALYAPRFSAKAITADGKASSTIPTEGRPKKQIPLRLSAKLYDQIAAWAEDDFRSVNGQIEYLLTECVRQRKKNGKYVSETMDEPPELDI